MTVPAEDGAAVRQGGERRAEDAPDRGGPAGDGAGRHGDGIKPNRREGSP